MDLHEGPAQVNLNRVAVSICIPSRCSDELVSYALATAVQVWTGENVAAKDIILDSEDHVINQAMFTISPASFLNMLKLFDQDGYQYAVLRRYDQHQEDDETLAFTSYQPFHSRDPRLGPVDCRPTFFSHKRTGQSLNPVG
jgi:hypothetical protein